MDFNITVLVVDDFASMRNIMKTSLKKMGYKNIIEAEDGDVALDILKKENIGLVLADWNMPRMKGLDLLKEIRKDDNLKDLPFIMVTAEGQKANVLEALHAGVNSYILKPYTPETLKLKVTKVMEQR